MAQEKKNVRRIQEIARSVIKKVLKPKMIGFSNDDNPSLGFKTSAGNMHWFVAENGDATHKSMKITNLTGSSTRNVGVTADGELVVSGGGGDELSSIWKYSTDSSIVQTEFSMTSSAINIHGDSLLGSFDKVLKMLFKTSAIAIQDISNKENFKITYTY